MTKQLLQFVPETNIFWCTGLHKGVTHLYDYHSTSSYIVDLMHTPQRYILFNIISQQALPKPDVLQNNTFGVQVCITQLTDYTRQTHIGIIQLSAWDVISGNVLGN